MYFKSTQSYPEGPKCIPASGSSLCTSATGTPSFPVQERRARFVAAEASFAEYRAVPLPEHEGRSALVDAALDPSAQRESSRHRFWPARPRSGVDASFLLTEQPRSAQEALSD